MISGLIMLLIKPTLKRILITGLITANLLNLASAVFFTNFILASSTQMASSLWYSLIFYLPNKAWKARHTLAINIIFLRICHSMQACAIQCLIILGRVMFIIMQPVCLKKRPLLRIRFLILQEKLLKLISNRNIACPFAML